MKRFIALALVLSGCTASEIADGILAARKVYKEVAKEATPVPVVTPQVTAQPTATPTFEATTEAGEEPATVDGAGADHVLWKPESDTHPKVAVVAVAADYINRYDLEVCIFRGKDKIACARTYSDHRGNKLPQHKFGRFNFKFGRKAESLPKNIELRFYVDGKRVTAAGLKAVKISDPTKRWLAESRRVRPDIKR